MLEIVGDCLMKVLALNLPQFHEIPENNEWWGQGFTEWTNVKRARPIYPGHKQPMVPLGNKYYDLSIKEDVVGQAVLAKRYGVSGFVYFHYWYEGRKLLQKPCEILLNSPEADIEYCFCWANHSWTRSWDGKNHQILLEQSYGTESDWEAHLEYFLPFFMDNRYVKRNNKPMLVIYNASAIPRVDDMVEFWNKRLIAAGFDGIYIVEYISSKNLRPACKYSQAVYEDEPMYTLRFEINAIEKARRVFFKALKRPEYQDYDKIWKLLLQKHRTYGGREIIQGSFTAWDNSPRRGNKGCMIVKGSSPIKFANYLNRLVKSNRQDVSNEYIIINAWNEWGEGAILEPSEQDGYGYLEAVRDSLRGTL